MGDSVTIFLSYFAATLVVITLAHFSRDTARQQLALYLAWNCVISQFWIVLSGYHGAPRLEIASDFGLAMLVAFTGYMNRSWVALTTLGLYGAALAFEAACFLYARDGSRLYFLGLNVILILQLFLIGGVSGWVVARRAGLDWPRLRRPRAYGHAPVRVRRS